MDALGIGRPAVLRCVNSHACACAARRTDGSEPVAWEGSLHGVRAASRVCSSVVPAAALQAGRG